MHPDLNMTRTSSSPDSHPAQEVSSSSSGDEATPNRRATAAELLRRVDALQRLPPAMAHTELHRVPRADLEGLVLLLMADLRTAEAPGRGMSGNVDVDWSDFDVAHGCRRPALGPGGRADDVSECSHTSSTHSTSKRLSENPVYRSSSPLEEGRGTNPQDRVPSQPSVIGFTVHGRGGILYDVASQRPEDCRRRQARSGSYNPLEIPMMSSSLAGTSSHSATAITPRHDSTFTHRDMTHLPEDHAYRHQSGAPAMIRLRNIHFYQDYVSDRFSDGRSLQSTIDELRHGTATPSSLPPLRVAKRSSDGKYYSLCNRRLACYHHVFRNCPDTLIPVLLRQELAANLLPQGDGKGMSVRVGGGIMLDGRLIWEIRHCCQT
jgi:hypothetical protein